MAKDEDVKVIVLGRDDCAIVYRGGEKENFECMLSNPINRNVGAGWTFMALINVLMKHADKDFIEFLSMKKAEYEAKIKKEMADLTESLAEIIKEMAKEDHYSDDPKVNEIQKKIASILNLDTPPYKLND